MLQPSYCPLWPSSESTLANLHHSCAGVPKPGGSAACMSSLMRGEGDNHLPHHASHPTSHSGYIWPSGIQVHTICSHQAFYPPESPHFCGEVLLHRATFKEFFSQTVHIT